MAKKEKPATVADVIPVRQKPEDEKPPTLVRWIVPHVSGPAYAHAHVSTSKLTACGGHHVEGAIYPPAPEVPRCSDCVAAVKRLKGGAADAG